MAPYPVQDNNRIVRDYFKSGAVLVRGILQVLFLGTFVGLELTMNAITKDIISVINDLLEGNDIHIQENLMTSSTIVSIVIYAIPVLLIAAAYFIIFAKSRSQSPDARPDAGFTILNVFAIIGLICAIITAAIGVIGVVYILISGLKNAQSNQKAGIIVSCVSLLISIGVMLAMMIVYKLYIGSVRKTAKTSELCNRGAKAYGVFSVLNAIGSAFSVLGTLALLLLHQKIFDLLGGLLGQDASEILGDFLTSKSTLVFLFLFVMALVSFITNILDAKIALGYNRHIKEAMMTGGMTGGMPMSGNRGYADENPRPARRKGYGDRFIED